MIPGVAILLTGTVVLIGAAIYGSITRDSADPEHVGAIEAYADELRAIPPAVELREPARAGIYYSRNAAPADERPVVDPPLVRPYVDRQPRHSVDTIGWYRVPDGWQPPTAPMWEVRP